MIIQQGKDLSLDVIKRCTLMKVMLRFFINHIRPIVFETEVADMRKSFLRILFVAELHSS